jgi:hypothetical protein
MTPVPLAPHDSFIQQPLLLSWPVPLNSHPPTHPSTQPTNQPTSHPCPQVLESMGLSEAFNVQLHVPALRAEEVARVLRQQDAFALQDIPQVCGGGPWAAGRAQIRGGVVGGSSCAGSRAGAPSCRLAARSVCQQAGRAFQQPHHCSRRRGARPSHSALPDRVHLNLLRTSRAPPARRRSRRWRGTAAGRCPSRSCCCGWRWRGRACPTPGRPSPWRLGPRCSRTCHPELALALPAASAWACPWARLSSSRLHPYSCE